jgi:hypothetical protein
MSKTILTVEERINRAKDGRKQSWIILRMNEAGCDMSEFKFSRKKKGFDEFTQFELKVLSEILNTDLNK